MFVQSVADCRFAAALAEAVTTAKMAALASRVSPTPGNFPILWATKIRLEMQLGLTLCAFNESCNPELFLPCHLGKPPSQISQVLRTTLGIARYY